MRPRRSLTRRNVSRFSTKTSCARFPASGRISRRRFGRSPKPETRVFTGSCWSSFLRRFSISSIYRAWVPKTVAQLYTELGIKTIEELEAACADGRVRGLKGLGKKKKK